MVAPMNEKRSDHCVAIVGEQLFAIGGRENGTTSYVVFVEVHIPRPSAETESVGFALPMER